MLLDFLETKSSENFLNFHCKEQGKWKPSFDDLNEKELRACFEYAGTSGYKVPVWAEVQKQAYND